MLNKAHIIANAKLYRGFGRLKVIISFNFNTKLLNISIDCVGQFASHLNILTYNLHIQHLCYLILYSIKGLNAI